MKATMDANGVITISAESSLEAFALRKWADMAAIQTNDAARMLNHHWDPRLLMVVAATPEPEAPPA